MINAMIELENVSRPYGDGKVVRALDNVSLRVDRANTCSDARNASANIVRRRERARQAEDLAHSARLPARRGLGIANTIERLRVLYRNDHRLAVRRPDEGGCVGDIELHYSTSATIQPQEREVACAS